jgi:hypothetical protein
MFQGEVRLPGKPAIEGVGKVGFDMFNLSEG